MAKERLVINQALCDRVRKLQTHKIEQKEIADMLGISLATIGRIKAAGYDMEQFKAMNEKRREKDQQKKSALDNYYKKYGKNIAQRQKILLEKFMAEKQAEDQEEQQPGQLQGQISMDLRTLDEKPQAEEQKKLYRFLAGQFDETEIAICDKLGKIYDMLGQILRAIRKE